MENKDEKYIGIAKAASILQMSFITLRKGIDKDIFNIPHLVRQKVQRKKNTSPVKYLFKESDLRAWMESNYKNKKGH